MTLLWLSPALTKKILCLPCRLRILTGNEGYHKNRQGCLYDLIAKLNLDSVVYPCVLTDEYILQYVRAQNNTKGAMWKKNL